MLTKLTASWRLRFDLCKQVKRHIGGVVSTVSQGLCDSRRRDGGTRIHRVEQAGMENESEIDSLTNSCEHFPFEVKHSCVLVALHTPAGFLSAPCGICP